MTQPLDPTLLERLKAMRELFKNEKEPTAIRNEAAYESLEVIPQLLAHIEAQDKRIAEMEHLKAAAQIIIFKLRGSEHPGPYLACTDCGRGMVWQREDRLGDNVTVGGWMCPSCVYDRMKTAESVAKDANLLAAATAHRACCGTEHDAANGKLHGYCVVCGVPWPCDTAQSFLAATRQPLREMPEAVRQLIHLAKVTMKECRRRGDGMEYTDEAIRAAERHYSPRGGEGESGGHKERP